VKPVINTIFGGFGFIGSELCKSFGRDNVPYQVFCRQDPLPTGDLGNIYYCAGVTADFRSRHFDTIEAHVSTLSEVLKNGEYTSFLYLSSARIYRNESLTTEDSTISINPLNSEDFVDISKLAGEALCLSLNDEKVRIVRLSNVFGNDFSSKNFLTEIIESALVKGEIHLRSGLASCKDYVDVGSVVDVMRRISAYGRSRIYNVASGYNVSHEKIVSVLKRLTGCSVTVEEGAPAIKSSTINVGRISQEFGFKPRCLIDELEGLVNEYKNTLLK
jgi:nucleoside-diphosphate-sugar epimerase